MSEIVITVQQGALKGKKETTYKGDTYYGFKGIPYAKPPLGKLRFRAPQPPEPWKGIRDATKHQDICVQTDFLSMEAKIIGSEDCLYLNVYTLEDPREVNGKIKPVLVWIHGGAFISGSGNSDNYGPDHLITEDVVLVTLNYRLNVFGFLRVDDPKVDVPGNTGLKDMVFALRWVKTNIEKFGGDPNNITIFGESAGGASVHLLSISPLAKGLFNQVIIQSGCALADWCLLASDVKPLHELAKVLNINEDNDEKIMQKLDELPTTDIIQGYSKIKFSIGDPSIFSPTIEKQSEGAFLSEHPLNIIQLGNFNPVPTIFGYTSREGFLMALNEKFLTVNDTEYFVPPRYGPKGSAKSKQIAEKINEFYYGGGMPSVENAEITYKLATDTYFLNPMYYAIREQLKVTSENIYIYRFSLDSTINFLKSRFRVTYPGVSHADELPYLFKVQAVDKQFISNSSEDLTVKRVTKLWSNFARFGDPNTREESELINVRWEPVKEKKFHFLDIGENLTVGINPDEARAQFWRNFD